MNKSKHFSIIKLKTSLLCRCSSFYDDCLHFDTRISGVSSDTFTDNECRELAQFALYVFNLTPKAMRNLIVNCENCLTPTRIKNDYTQCETDLNNLLRLNKFEQSLFSEPGDGFINCDTGFLYKIIRFYKRVYSPTRGWNKEVHVLENDGDLVELLRQMRNNIVHRPNIPFSENEMYHMKLNMCTVIATISILVDTNEELINQMRNYMAWS